MSGSKRFALRPLALVLAASLTVALFPAAGLAGEFEDIIGHWGEERIRVWLDEGWIEGYDDGTFRPDQEVSRAEFVAFMNRAYGVGPSEADPGFPDVDEDDWYFDHVAAAVDAELISGYPDGTFGPGYSITREEAAVIANRLLDLEEREPDEPFADQDEISDWALEAVQTLAAAGLISGYDDGTFRPGEPITRAESVAILDRGVVADVCEPREVSNQEELVEALEDEHCHIVFADDITADVHLEVVHDVFMDLNGHTLSLDGEAMTIYGDQAAVEDGRIRGLDAWEETNVVEVAASAVEFTGVTFEIGLVDDDAQDLELKGSTLTWPDEFYSDVYMENCTFAEGLEWAEFHHPQARLEACTVEPHVFLVVSDSADLQDLELVGDEDFSVLSVVGGAQAVLDGATALGEQTAINVDEDSVLETRGEIEIAQDKWMRLYGEGKISGQATFTGPGELLVDAFGAPGELLLTGVTLEAETSMPDGVAALEDVTLTGDLEVGSEARLALRGEIDNVRETTIWVGNEAEIDIAADAVLTQDIREQVTAQVSQPNEAVEIAAYFEEFAGWYFGDPQFLPVTWRVDAWLQLDQDIEAGTIAIEINGADYYADAADHDFEEGVYLSEMIEEDRPSLQDQSGRGELLITLAPAVAPGEGDADERHLTAEVHAFNDAGEFQILLAEDDETIRLP